jgi:RecA-family ATPase
LEWNGKGKRPLIDPNTDLWLPEFLKQKPGSVPWLIEPFLPAGGVVFMHGPTSTGKSPLTWKIATCVSNGVDFFGYKVQKTGPVLYVELDTPANLIHPRLAKLEVKPDQMHLSVFSRPLNIINPDSADVYRLSELYNKVKPVLVIVNTLRKSHASDDKESHVPSLVYGAWQSYFPGATILIVHHDKKEQEGQNPDQAFSGNQAWANDAQVSLHLVRRGNYEHKDDEKDEHKKTLVSLKMTKSQVSDHELFQPLHLQLCNDGTNWEESGPDSYRKYFSNLDKNLSRAARIEATMLRFGMGKSAIYNACKGLD